MRTVHMLLALLALALPAQAKSLHQTVLDGEIEAQCKAVGYLNAKLTLRNVSKQKVAVDLLGSFLQPFRGKDGKRKDRSVQPLALAFTTTKHVREVVIEPGKTWSGVMRTFCMRKRASAPSGSTLLRVARKKAPGLIVHMLGYWHDHPEIEQGTVQEAVWRVMALPARLRDQSAAKALKMLGRKDNSMVAELIGHLDMAVTRDGQLFFGQGALADLRRMGVSIPDLDDSLVVARPGKEQRTKLAPHVVKGQRPLKVRRYLGSAAHLFATSKRGLFRYDAGARYWVYELDVLEAKRVVGPANGPLYLLTQGGTVYTKASPAAGRWTQIPGYFSDVVYAPGMGVLALDRKARSMMRRSGGQWVAVMPTGVGERFYATKRRLYRHSPTRGAIYTYDLAKKRWKSLVAEGAKQIWAGTTHVYWVNEKGQLWVAWDGNSAPRMIEKSLGHYYVAAIRPGVDHLYVKTRAHLVIVYDPKHDQ